MQLIENNEEPLDGKSGGFTSGPSFKVPNIKVVIPAFNEEKSVGKVLREIPKKWVTETVVVNNASTDETSKVASENGATVLSEKQKGYGKACLTGLAYLDSLENKPDIVVFMDADYSDYPEQLPEVIRPILEDSADLVIGSRALGARQSGSMTPQQIFGNWLATWLLHLFYGVKFTDLGPFRAVRYDALQKIKMKDQDFGWTVEMQLKAAKLGLKSVEVPVDYRKRVGVSKVSGTVKGTIMAGYKIITTIFKYL